VHLVGLITRIYHDAWSPNVKLDNFAFAICGGKAGKLSALRNELEYRPSNTDMV